MKEKRHQIETESVLMVTNDCPLGFFSLRSYTIREQKLHRCTECDFFLGAEECGYRLYETRLIEHTSDTEPDDGSGAMPDTDYIWNFICSKCRKVVRFSSGFSEMISGDFAMCSDCKTKHRYINNSNGIYFFALQIDTRGVDNERR